MNASAQPVLTAPERLGELVGRLEAQAGFADGVASLQLGLGATIGGVWGSSCAIGCAALADHAPAALVVVCSHGDRNGDLCGELALVTTPPAVRFPGLE